MWANVEFYTFRVNFEFYLIKFAAILYFPHLPCHHHPIILPFDGVFDRLKPQAFGLLTGFKVIEPVEMTFSFRNKQFLGNYSSMSFESL